MKKKESIFFFLDTKRRVLNLCKSNDFLITIMHVNKFGGPKTTVNLIATPRKPFLFI